MGALSGSSMEACDRKPLESPSSVTIMIPVFIKIVAFSSFFSFTLFLLFHYPEITFTRNINLPLINYTETHKPLVVDAPPEAGIVVERTGIVNENGVMTEDFVVGEIDESLINALMMDHTQGYEMEKQHTSDNTSLRIQKFTVCDESKMHYTPCRINVLTLLEANNSLANFDRCCPENSQTLDCLIPRPLDYKLHTPWPQCKNEVWLDNLQTTGSINDDGDQSLISRKDDKFVFVDVGNYFTRVAVDQYVDELSKMVPDIAFGQRTRVVLDIGPRIASLSSYLIDKNVITLSIGVNDNKMQYALERGVPAMVVSFGTKRLPFASQAFDLIHCSDCRGFSNRNDGLWLLEANRMLRGGGYFVWAMQPSHQQTDAKVDQWNWNEFDDLTSGICWQPKGKNTNFALWQKPQNNSCYLSRGPGVKPPLCDTDDNPDDLWYVNAKKCIAPLPENGYGFNVTAWPARLHSPPERLFLIQMDALESRRELYEADTRYWNEIVKGYIGAFRIFEMNIRNVMDMKAGYGGFAAALLDNMVDCWVMNVVPVSAKNTLPVIFDRGLVGVLHDWCEPFDTYPRTYDLLNAADIFSVETERCNITSIILEMDRILRPGGHVYIRDTRALIHELKEIIDAVGWKSLVFDSEEGPYSNQMILVCEKLEN